MKAYFSKTTTDMHKSKILNKQLVQLVLDVYITPDQFASLLKQFDTESGMEIEIK